MRIQLIRVAAPSCKPLKPMLFQMAWGDKTIIWEKPFALTESPNFIR